MFVFRNLSHCAKLLDSLLPRTHLSCNARNLYSATSLGIDNYANTRERIRAQFESMESKFKSKMQEFVKPDCSSMIFTEDLKHMVHIAGDSEEDIELVKGMMLKFCQQNKTLRFGSFVFGPVVMRMFHHLNQPKEAFDIFMNPSMDGFFDQLISFQILMDLLLTNGMYQEVIKVFDTINNKQLQGALYPKNAVVLVCAACYHLNTPEAFEYIKNLWSKLNEVGHFPMRRAVTFAASLAITQGAPDIALEILSSVKQPGYVTIRNLKVCALAELGRPDDALPILRSVLEVDRPQEKKSTFAEETIERMKNSVKKLDNSEVTQEFNRIEDQLRSHGHINSTALSEQLCSEISGNVLPRNRGRDSSGYSQSNTRRFAGHRPGLQDML